jgi:hypothetical protein
MIKVVVARALFIVIFILLGALAMGWWTNRENIANQQLERINSFIAAGPRFTGKDGQELCKFVNIVADHSYGFKKSGLPLMDCEKYSRGIK